MNNIGNTTTLVGSADAIWFGPGTNPGTVTNVNVERNIISNVNSVGSSRSSRGIYIGPGGGSVVSPTIKDNTIFNLMGTSTQAIKLENNITGGLVSNNFIYGINSTNNDATGIFTNINGVSTMAIHENSITTVLFAIKNQAANNINATCNWLGSTVPATNAALIAGPVTYNPWLCAGTDVSGSVGFQGVPCNSLAPVVTTNGASPVQCLASATAPTIPPVFDVDGTTLLPAVLVSMVDSPDPIDCQGTRTYTYSFTNCSGFSSNWSYVYTIQHVTSPVLPANGGSSLECMASVTTPTPPTGIVDVCGKSVLAVAAIIPFVDSPTTITCEGTRTYSFTYTDCAGLVSTWNYVYTIDHTTLPKEIGGPVAIASTVQCESAATAPATLPAVKDVCGNVLTLAAPVKQLSFTNTFDAPVVTGSTPASGVWYTDRYAPAGFTSPVVFNGGNRLKHSINASDYQGTGIFYNTQGRGYDLGTATNAMEVKLYIPAAWATSNKRMAGLWGVAVDATNAVSGYPIVEFTSDGGVPRFRVWESNGTNNWVDLGLPASFAYDTWVTLKIRLLPSGEFLLSAGSLTYLTHTSAVDASVRLKSVILQGHNYDPSNPLVGVTYDIYWDDFTWNDTYAPIACEGAVTYTYEYTDCAGLSNAWTYTYTIERLPFTNPTDAGSIVGSAALAVTPTLPTVTDNCGNTLTPTGPTMGGTMTGCTGTITYTYVYTDCAGNTQNWVYTYTVVTNTISGNLTYYNTANTAMNNVIIQLKQGVSVMHTATTNGSGNYTFSGVCAGTYNVVFSTVKPVGGINATDAAQVNAWGVGPQYLIEKVRFFAGDVMPNILNNILDAGDAGKILQHFVTAGNPAFTPNWSFWKTGETTSIQNPDSSLTLTVNGNLTNNNYYAMCKGDFNGSFTPGGLKSGSDHLTLNTRQNLQINSGTVFELPVYADMDMNVGAISLIMNFPSDKLEINGVYLSNNPGISLQYNVTGNELRIGWNSLQALSLLNGDRLVTLMVKAKESVVLQDILFTLAADPLNELADENYNVINNALLTMDIINSTALVIHNMTLTENLTLSNHPNPFKGNTILDYNLPFDGQVTLEIYDIVGKKIKTALNETQTAGAHALTMDANDFAAGVYTCTLQLKNKNSIKTLTIKIISK